MFLGPNRGIVKYNLENKTIEWEIGKEELTGNTSFLMNDKLVAYVTD
jgi:hypothetical protein